MKFSQAAVLMLSLFGAAFAQDSAPPLTSREKMLLDKIEELEKRVAVLEQRDGTATVAAAPAAPIAAATASSPTQPTAPPPDPLRGTTVNLALDGYYGYNFNNPIGRVNLLRAYDVSSNSFSLNQANVVLENAPDPATGKRFGARLDLQWGQATQTLQGNPANEPRPEIYRAIFQAYGTYVAPLGGGLTLDFGKWASSIGIEGNYTKDQMNYSRSLWFDFLPFYHMGVRASYKINNVVAANYWLVNGTQEVEDFNGFKDELFGLVVTPNKNLSWTINYYLGQDHPDTIYYPNGERSARPSRNTRRSVLAHPQRAQRPHPHLRFVRLLAGDSQTRAGSRRRLRNRAAAAHFRSLARLGRRGLREISDNAEIRSGLAGRIPFRSWRPLQRHDASDQGNHLYG